MSQVQLSVKFDTGAVKQFSTLAEVKDWAANETRVSSWMNASLAHHRAGDFANRLQGFRETLGRVSQYAGSSEIDQTAKWLEKISAEFGSLLSESKIVPLLSSVAKRNGILANAGLALSLGLEDSKRHDSNSAIAPQFWAAEALLAAFTLSPPAIRGDARKLLAEAKKCSETFATGLSRFSEESEKVISEHGAAMESQQSQFDARLAAIGVEFGEFMTSAKKEFEDQREYFRRELSLQAPILYWTSVASTSRKWSRVWGAIFGAEVLFLLLFLYIESGDLLSYLSKSDMDLGVVIALVVATSTLALWAMRMTARIFLSNYHRSADAVERTTMLQTFLALTHDNKISDDQISLVLSAVFRPGATGLVKDDAAPEFGAAALLSRFERK
jgi:hypothetical protein